ncbi:MAG TPA: hypothetical protein VH643_25755 [Gemmataceae bacterium]|jgi:hypothetical protein
MFQMLIRGVGLLLILGALPAAWFGFEALDDIRAHRVEIDKLKSEMAAHRFPKEQGEKGVAASQQRIADQKRAIYLWFGAAVGALVLGGGLVLFPSSRKPKKPILQTGLNHPEPIDDTQAASGIKVGGGDEGKDPVANPIKAREGTAGLPESAVGREPRRDVTGPDCNG